MEEEEILRERVRIRVERRMDATRGLKEFLQLSVVMWFIWFIASRIFHNSHIIEIWEVILALSIVGGGIYVIGEYIDAVFLANWRERWYQKAFMREMALEREQLGEDAREKHKRLVLSEEEDRIRLLNDFEEKSRRQQ